MSAEIAKLLESALKREDILTARLLEYQKDAARMDFWQLHGSNMKISPPTFGFEWSAVVPGRSVYAKTLRGVIDAAIAARGQS